MPSLLQDWTQQISLRQQGVLVIALRGPDGVRKEDAAKPLVRTVRGLVMNAGRTGAPVSSRDVWPDDPFMTVQHIHFDDAWRGVVWAFFDQWDSYNVHYLQHLIHAYAILGIHHPVEDYREKCWNFYLRCARKLHFNPETKEQVQYRLRDGLREEDGKGD